MNLLFKKILYAGVKANDPKHIIISIATTNGSLLFVFVQAVAWAIISKTILNLDSTFLINTVGALVTLFVYLGMHISAPEKIRPIAILLLLFYFSFINLNLGFGSGVEFYTGPLIFFIFVIAPEINDFKNVAIKVLTITVIISTFVAMTYIPPFLNLPPEIHFTGYRLTIFWVTILSVVLLMIYGSQSVYQLQELELEKAKTSAILSDVLPDIIAKRLETETGMIADSHGGAGVLFADLEGFTVLSRTMAPSQLIEILNDLYSRIDDCALKNKIEKIKTIGDSYMAACGILDDNNDPDNLIKFAIELRDIVRCYSKEIGYPLDARIGIGYGQVISGIIGKSKKSFDLWGETVNLASRMESTGELGRIQVTETLFWRLRNKYKFEKRSGVDVKGYGMIDTYYLVES